MRITLPQGRYEKAEEKKAFFENALARLGAIPGVVAAAETYAPPSCCAAPSVLEIAGKKHPGTSYVRYEPVSAEYFHALRTPLLHGRLFTQDEIYSARRVAVVNRSMVSEYFPSGEAVGQKIEFSSFDTQADYPHDAWFEIVGVVGDVKNVGLRSPVMPEAYIPYTSYGRTTRSLLVRTVADPLSLLPRIRQEISAVEPGAAVTGTTSMQEFLTRNTYAKPLFGLFVLVSFAGIGMLLVTVGVFSVMAYTVSLQTHEIGVRMALGAQRSQLLSMVLMKGMRMILTGIAIGLVASFAFARVAASQFWGVAPADAWTFSVVPLLLLFVALMACLLPARRAMNVDPLIAMRYE
jgi:putative ABC transport system permease protein